VMNGLMLQLGFGDGYAVQGGDIGSKIARVIAAKHEACKAIHRTLFPGTSSSPTPFFSSPLTYFSV
jgi:hypothetical protein